MTDTIDERRDFVICRVNRRARTRGCRYAEPTMQGFRAVVADSHGDAEIVEKLPNIVRVHAIHSEARKSYPWQPRGWTE